MDIPLKLYFRHFFLTPTRIINADFDMTGGTLSECDGCVSISYTDMFFDCWN